MCDHGYMQLNAVEALELQGAITGKKFNEKKREQLQAKLGQVTGAVNWRQPGIKYKRNEIFIDVIEQVVLS